VKAFLQRLIGAPEIYQKLCSIEKGQKTIMDALADLKAAVANLNASVSNEISAVTTAIQTAQTNNAGAVSATDAEAIVTQLGTLKSTLDAETAALTTPAAPAQPGGTGGGGGSNSSGTTAS
jgi:hypothetical protein